ncbi:MAG: DNA-3-methyladenine glycosylase I [Candidatus Woesearchaeota archaeon]
MTSYCRYARNQPQGNHHREHHDTEHGFPPTDDDDLFRRMMLEISQAGLSFDIALKKKESIYEAFNSIDTVAGFSEKDIEQLMHNQGIIRNRRKILAAITNAQKIQELQKEYGSFWNWLNKQNCTTREEWTKLFKKTFTFTGGEIVNEFMMSIGLLPGAHDQDCIVGKRIKKSRKIA